LLYWCCKSNIFYSAKPPSDTAAKSATMHDMDDPKAATIAMHICHDSHDSFYA
jgi:hypothetical protein